MISKLIYSILIGFFVLISNCSYAQTKPSYSVSGSLEAVSHTEKIELATVALFKENEKLPLEAVLSDSAGNFLLQNVMKGKYLLRVTYVGFENYEIKIELTENKNLGVIVLKKSEQALKEATITAQKPTITKTAEKTVVNVSNSAMAQMGTAEDLFKNLPGVSVDQNGKITMVGKQGVRILVDGRPNAFAQSNMAAFLKSLPANSVETIELITNPSAKYDAEGKAGIINIKLKKGKADGLNGSVSASYGYVKNASVNGQLNYRKNKWNLFGSYAFDNRNFNNAYNEIRKVSFDTITTLYDMKNKGVNPNQSHTVKLGFDYFINDKSSFTYSSNANIGNEQWNSSSLAKYEKETGELITKFLSTTYSPTKNFSITNDLSFKHKYDSTEREFNLSLTHTYVKSDGESKLISSGYDVYDQYLPLQSINQRTVTKGNIQNIIVQMDYAEPLPLQGWKIETGLKNETTLNKNNYDLYKTTAWQQVEFKDTLLSNNFQYNENIAALYAILSGSHKSWFNFSVGLRTEHTFIKSNNSKVSRNYLSWFPNANLNFSINQKNNLSFSYSRRVQRPGFQQINNVITYFDQYSTWEGNPSLRPSFSENLSIEYSLMMKQHMISIGTGGMISTDEFSEFTKVDSNRITRSGVFNGSNSKQFWFSMFTKLQLTKWWEWQLNHFYAFQTYSAKAGVNTGSVSGHYYNLWSQMNFKFWKSMKVEMSGWFNTGGVFAQGKSKPVGSFSMGVSKSFLKDRLTVGATAQNILNTMKWQWYVNNANIHTDGSWQMFNRTVFVNVSYRFGKDAQSLRRKIQGADERLTGGGGKGK